MHGISYITFTNILFEELSQKDIDAEGLIQAKAQELRSMEAHKTLSEDKLQNLAYSEAVAEMMETELTDTDAISRISRKLKQEDKSLWGRIKNFLQGLVDALKKAYQGLTPDSRIAATTREAIASSEAILNAYVDAAADAVENYNLQDGQKSNAPEGVQKMERSSFTEDKYFARQMDKWEDLDAKKVRVGKVEQDSALYKVGIPDTNIYFDVSKIRTAMEKHGDHLSAETLKGIPALLNDPIVICEYTGPNGDIKNTVNVYGNLFHNEYPVVVGIVMRLDRSGQNVISNIRTVHARSNFAKGITNDTVLYLNEDKKRTRKWFQVCGNLNVPLEGTQFGLIRSIQYEAPYVKGEFLKSSRNPQKQLEAWEAENERLKLEVEYLQKVVQIHKQGNRDYTLDKNSLKSQALDLMKSNNAKGDTSELAAIMDELYRYFATDENWQWDELQEKAGKAADWLMEHQKHSREDYAQSALDWMAKRHVRLNDTQLAEIQYQFGSLSEFKKAVKGTIIIDQQADTQMDQLWQEGVEEYGYLFDESVSDADMPRAFAELVQGLKDSKSVDQAELEYDRENWRRDLIEQILDKFHQVKPVESVSDKMKQQIQQLKQEHKEAVAQLKSRQKNSLDEVREAGKRALAEYRRQRDITFKAKEAVYNAELEQIKKAHERDLTQLRTQYGEDTKTMQTEFMRLLREYDACGALVV